ncbi:MAG TPA: cytochrome P450 [Actinomycetota bacterium]|nr:cytochrome P450 [Actinomycetota bacterium]
MTRRVERPGPPLSGLRALAAFRRDPLGVLIDAARYGDLVRIDLPRYPAHLVNHPDLIREVLVADGSRFEKGPTMQAARRTLGQGLLTSEGEVHKRQRRMIQPIFHHDRIDGYGEAMVEEAVRVTDGWSDGRVLDLRDEMAQLTLAIVARTLFGARVGTTQAREIGDALALQLTMFDRVFSPLFVITDRLPLPSNRRFDRAKAAIDAVVERMIARRRQEDTAGNDLLSLLIGAQEDGQGMSDRQVRDEAITLFLAGHETTANALTWTWHLLSAYPEAEERLHAEVDEALGDRPPTVGDLPRLAYTRMVLTESMRLLPPAWAIGRRATVPLELGDRRLPRGAVVVVSPYLVHRDPRWYRDPEAFAPERWSEDRSAAPRLAYLPFGAGSRMCIGEPFAWLEGVLVLATLARAWRFRTVPGHPIELQPVITLRPRFGVVATAHRRRRG